MERPLQGKALEKKDGRTPLLFKTANPKTYALSTAKSMIGSWKTKIISGMVPFLGDMLIFGGDNAHSTGSAKMTGLSKDIGLYFCSAVSLCNDVICLIDKKVATSSIPNSTAFFVLRDEYG